MTESKAQQIHAMHEDGWIARIQRRLSDMLQTIDVAEGNVAELIAKHRKIFCV